MSKQYPKKQPSRGKTYRDKPQTEKNVNVSGLQDQMRLNKYLAHAGICSRREADKFIEQGMVSVNGKIVTEMGHKVSPTDQVKFGGETLRRESLRYIVMNKPKGYITTMDDPRERKKVIDLLVGIKERVYPVGRLDRNTTGVLLFTNDGDLAKVLTHPRYNVSKLYHVILDKSISKRDLLDIEEGITLDDGFIKPDEVDFVEGGKRNEVGIKLHSGKNRIVRRIFEHMGYKVDKLDRTSFAGITKKHLKRSEFRELTEQEVASLKKFNPSN